MQNTLLQFLNMGGYGFYVWSAYGTVFGILAIQLFRPWRHWQKIIRENKTVHDE